MPTRSEQMCILMIKMENEKATILEAAKIPALISIIFILINIIIFILMIIIISTPTIAMEYIFILRTAGSPFLNVIIGMAFITGYAGYRAVSVFKLNLKGACAAGIVTSIASSIIWVIAFIFVLYSFTGGEYYTSGGYGGPWEILAFGVYTIIFIIGLVINTIIGLVFGVIGGLIAQKKK